MAWASSPARQGQQRSLRRMCQVFSWALAPRASCDFFHHHGEFGAGRVSRLGGPNNSRILRLTKVHTNPHTGVPRIAFLRGVNMFA